MRAYTLLPRVDATFDVDGAPCNQRGWWQPGVQGCILQPHFKNYGPWPSSTNLPLHDVGFFWFLTTRFLSSQKRRSTHLREQVLRSLGHSEILECNAVRAQAGDLAFHPGHQEKSDFVVSRSILVSKGVLSREGQVLPIWAPKQTTLQWNWGAATFLGRVARLVLIRRRGQGVIFIAWKLGVSCDKTLHSMGTGDSALN